MSLTESKFQGFSPKAFAFLRGLKRNNERPWFDERKPTYEAELLAPLRALVETTTAELASAKVPIRGDVKRSIFRIYRDVRFSRDKSPYKTHLSAYLSYDGEKATPGGLYVHIEPGRSMIAAAFYAIDKPLLTRWRTAMATRPGAFEAVLKALQKRGRRVEGPEAHEDSLARMPRGFESMADSALAPYFRLKSFTVRESLDDEDASSAALPKRIVALAKETRPLFDYGWALE